MPARGQSHLTPLYAPEQVFVKLGENGLPAAVATRRSGAQIVHLVRDTWRIDEEWWRLEPTSRQYYELVMECGRLDCVYHDLISGQWFRQRY